MENSQYSELAQQLSSSTQGARAAIKGETINEKLQSVKDFFEDQSQVLIGKQIEESLGKLRKAGGVLKSLGLKAEEVQKMASDGVSRVGSVGKQLGQDVRAKVQQRLAGRPPQGEEPVQQEPEQEDIVAEREAQTAQESIARGGGSVLGEDAPLAGSSAAAQADVSAAAREIQPPPSTDEQQSGSQEQGGRNKQGEDEDESGFERDISKATKDVGEEDVADPIADEVSLPLTAILGGASLIAGMFVKDHHKTIVQKATPSTSYAVQIGI